MISKTLITIFNVTNRYNIVRRKLNVHNYNVINTCAKPLLLPNIEDGIGL